MSGKAPDDSMLVNVRRAPQNHSHLLLGLSMRDAYLHIFGEKKL